MGDGRQKVYALLGPLLRSRPQQHDQLRRHAQRLASAKSRCSPTTSWVTYRTRGGPVAQDAFFAPTTKTPYTDDITIGYAVDLGNNMSLGSHLHQPPDARHPRGLRPRALCTRSIYPGSDDGPELVLPAASTTSATRRTPGRELRHRHAERRQARLTTASTSCCGSATPTTGRCSCPTPTTTPRATRTPTRTPTSRATCCGSTPRAVPVRPSAGLD